MNRLVRRIGAPTVLVAVLAGASAVPAQAADGTITVAYDAVGSSTVAKTGSVVALGPSTLTITLAGDGTFTGSLPFAPTATSFKIIGLIPVSATVTFVPAGPVTGKLGKAPKNRVSSVANYYLQLSNVKTAGLPTPVGDNCRTADPVSISIGTPAGKKFNITTGGKLAGTFTIGNFANCGLTTGLLNLLIPGEGNTANLTLSNGRLTS